MVFNVVIACINFPNVFTVSCFVRIAPKRGGYRRGAVKEFPARSKIHYPAAHGYAMRAGYPWAGDYPRQNSHDVLPIRLARRKC